MRKTAPERNRSRHNGATDYGEQSWRISYYAKLQEETAKKRKGNECICSKWKGQPGTTFSFDTHVTFQLPFLSQIIASQGPQEVDREIVRLWGGVRTELPMIYKPVIAAQPLLCDEEQSNHPAASLWHPHHTALNNSSCQQQRDSDFPLETLCKGSLTECNLDRQKLGTLLWTATRPRFCQMLLHMDVTRSWTAMIVNTAKSLT